MLQKDRIEVTNDPKTNELMYTYVDDDTVKVFNQMEFTEKQIFKAIQNSGDMGCTINEIKTSVMQQNPDF